jgi:AcrR family transcriptional regulator
MQKTRSRCEARENIRIQTGGNRVALMATAPRTKTPWGDAETLRERRLSPRSGASPEEVARSQRERLMAAMVAVCPERGYEATTVAELLSLSRVSRADFYRHFADKQACFMAALEEILERAMRFVALRYDGRGSALRSFIELIVEQPAAARLCFVESYAAGREALGAMDGAVATVEELYEQAFKARDGEAQMPVELAGAIVGGLRKVIYTRLRRGQEATLSELAGQMWDWSFDYQAPPISLLRRRVQVGSAAGIYQPRDPAERLIAASIEAVAAKGYMATTIEEIVGRAGVSLSTFYEQFEGKEELVVAALDAGQARLFGLTYPAYRRARQWPTAVASAIEAMFAFLAAEPEFAQMAMVEVFATGARTLERRDRTIDGLRGYLAPGYELSPGTPAIAGEAIGGATYALIYEQIRRHGAGTLPRLAPTASYLALAPFLGAEEACAVASGRGR